MRPRTMLAVAMACGLIAAAAAAVSPAPAATQRLAAVAEYRPPCRPRSCPSSSPTPAPTTSAPTAPPTTPPTIDPTPPPTTAPPATGEFQVTGTRIVDPDGKVFTPVGANVNGPSFVWGGPTIGESARAADSWHWNTLRVNVCWANTDGYPDWDTVWPGHPTIPSFNGCENGGGWHWTANNDLDKLVAEYTAKRIVTMIDLQHFDPGAYPNSTAMPFVEHWWSWIAAKYAGNPYVWFNPLNEPGGDPSTLAQWNSVTDRLAGVIRAAAPRNIIVADGSNFGQEAYDWKCTADIPYANSGILTYGPQLQAKHGNMVFSLHAYGEWGGAAKDQWSGCSADPATFQQQLDTRLTNYLDRVQSAGVPLLIGEFGSHPPPVPLSDWDAGQDKAVDTVFRIAPARGIGVLWWHGDDGSSYILLTQGGSGSYSWECLGDPAHPDATLTPYGKLLSDYAHQVNP